MGMVPFHSGKMCMSPWNNFEPRATGLLSMKHLWSSSAATVRSRSSRVLKGSLSFFTRIRKASTSLR